MPTLLRTLLSGLPVVTEETDLATPLPSGPEPEDLEAVAQAVAKRRIEYLAGRHCARVALGKLGVDRFVLRAGADRAPVWPPGIVGSITHTGTPDDGFCGAAVARATDLAALGVDAELARPLAADLVPMVLTPRERSALSRWPAPDQGWIATLFFSAKESVYKALFPLTGSFIDFQDVEVDFDIYAGRFRAARAGATPALNATFEGRALVTPRLLLTAVTIDFDHPLNVRRPLC